jgi:murein DD-endopeptidase MepM/ murein hydrolase activator NlpD
MRLIPPLKGIKSRPLYPQSDDIYFTQHYGNVWIADRDMVINGKQIKAGDNVYQVAFGMPFHNGDDIAAPLGTKIIACHNARLN